MKAKLVTAALAALALAVLPTLAFGQEIIDDSFTGVAASLNWKAFNGACLTAGNNTGTVPACVGLAYYQGQTQVGGYTGTLPDPSGHGALRFNNGYAAGSPSGNFDYGFNQAGSIISNFTYPTTEGLQITFTTMTYEGNSYGIGGVFNANDGADGISFFLVDDSVLSSLGLTGPYDTGAFGGSLGYTCSNTNDDPTTRPIDGSTRGYDGLIGAYLGLGIDEFGNFLNGENNLTPCPTGACQPGTGDNTATGYGPQPGRIGLRGMGSVAWKWLNANYSTDYPTKLLSGTYAQTDNNGNTAWQAAVQSTCETGTLWNYSSTSKSSGTWKGTNTGTAVSDYGAIPSAYSILPSTVTLANESATQRSQATPITYKLKITGAGLLTFAYSVNGGAFQTVIANQDITTSNGALPANLRFGFSGSTGGGVNVHEVSCFEAAPSDTASSSAGIDERQTAKVQTGSQVYFAYYNPNNWSGSLTASNLVVDSTTGLLSVQSTANWDAGCVLTGILPNATCGPNGQFAGGASGVGAEAIGTANINSPASGTPTPLTPARVMLTCNATAAGCSSSSGTAFQAGSLNGTQKSELNAGDSLATQRVAYLRGDRTDEQTTHGANRFRDRVSVLGDIVDSSPTWVGAPGLTYPATWTDKLYGTATNPENSGPTYATYATNNATRLNVIYAGANDGFLHGFRSGSYSSTGSYVANSTTPNDGWEVLAYMPNAIVKTIHSTTAAVDFSNPQYGHNFFVDASPGTGDVYYNSAWHTWLIGGLGSGGKAIYALDITNPTNFTEGNAATLVMGEWDSTTITCVNSASCNTYLGNTWGIPQIRRFHNGTWGAVFGNGLGTSHAGIYVMLINSSSGAVTFYYLAAGAAGQGGTAGIAYADPVDLDGDHIIDYVYAGDVKGNIWRFDLTSNNPSNWAVSATSPLFTTPGGQPITTKLVVVGIPSSSGAQRVLVEFGTGQQTPFTNTSATTYASGTQSLYGIWDWDMDAPATAAQPGWNARSSVQYAGISVCATGCNLTTDPTITTAQLEQQIATDLSTGPGGYRSVTNNPICWDLTTDCASGNTQFGWYLNLPDTNEQVIYNPVDEVGAFIVNTTVPAQNDPTNCTSALASGWTMAISPVNGGSFTQSFFADSTGHFVNYNGQIVSGVALSGTGSVSIVTTTQTVAGAPTTFLVTQTTAGTPTTPAINPLASSVGNRLTWVQRR